MKNYKSEQARPFRLLLTLFVPIEWIRNSANSKITSKIFTDDCLAKLLGFCEVNPEPLSLVDERHDCLTKRRAISILANGLAECNSCQEGFPRKLVSESFIQLLLSFLGKSSRDPHQAFQAARCLVELASSNPDVKALLLKSNAISLLPSTECPHLALEQESKKLEAILSS
jgi:hypothetical protein